MNAENKKFLFIVLLLHLVIALPLAYELNIWADEASTLHTTGSGILHAIQFAARHEKQAPLYFWILSLWRDLNGSIFFARLFSIICSLAAIAFFYDLARKLFDSTPSKIVTVFFAFHTYLFWASFEIRLYALVIAVSAALLDLFYEGYLTEGENSRKKLQTIYITLAIFGLYVNYFVGFLLVGCFAALLAAKRWRSARTYFWQMLIVLAAIAPLLLIVKQQLVVNTAGFIEEQTFYAGTRMLWNSCLTFILPTEILSGADASVISIGRLWLVRLAIIGAIFSLIRNRGGKFSGNLMIFGAISGVIVLFFLGVYFVVGSDYIAVRHLAILFVPFTLFIASVFFAVVPQKFRLIGAAICAFFFVYGLISIYPNFTKRGDWARVGAYLERNEKPDQPIVIFNVFQALALPYHYQGANKILPDDRFFDFASEAEMGSPNAFRREIEYVISRIPPDAPELWLITDEKCSIKDSCLPLENFVRSNYTIVREKDFYMEKVRLLRKKNL